VAKAVIAKTIDTEYDPHPQYSYSYDVHDGITGDAKTQQETRDGDVVQGSYSLVEADGTRRVVHYTADDHNGFNAVVEKQPATLKAVAAPYPLAYAASAPLVKTVAAAPALTYAAGPSVAYSTPVLKTYAAAPRLAYSTPAFNSYAATAPVVKTLAPVAYPSPYAHSYPSPYAHSYPSPYAHSYATQYSRSFSAPALAYDAAIPVAHSPVHATYAAAHEYASKW
jgi:hypothetical protein